MAEFRRNRGYNGGGNDRGNTRGGGDRGGSRGGYRGGNDSRGGSRGGDGFRPQMHRATCAECHDSCEVPFRPTGERPVLCSNCFGNSRGETDRRDDRRGGRDGHRGQRNDRNDRGNSRPKQDSGASKVALDEIRRRVDLVNKKIDSLIEMVQKLDIAQGGKIRKAELRETIGQVIEEFVEE